MLPSSLSQTASSEDDSGEEEEDGGSGQASGGLSVGGTWQRQEDVLRRMHQQRNDILVCLCNIARASCKTYKRRMLQQRSECRSECRFCVCERVRGRCVRQDSEKAYL